MGTAVMGRSVKRWKAPRAIPALKPLPPDRKLPFLDTCEQMNDGSNLSSNKFAFILSAILTMKIYAYLPPPLFLIFTVQCGNLG